MADLLDQLQRLDHHAVGDHRQAGGIEDPRRQHVQDDLLSPVIHGMPGVVAALEARHHVERTGQVVDGLALALVAPLQAQHHCVHVLPCSRTLMIMMVKSSRNLVFWLYALMRL